MAVANGTRNGNNALPITTGSGQTVVTARLLSLPDSLHSLYSIYSLHPPYSLYSRYSVYPLYST